VLTLEEQATNFDTMRHIEQVRNNLNMFIYELLQRSERHDQSKLEPPEVSYFTENTKALSALTYGSDEYKAQLKKIQPALDHHYAKNRHHPEHFKNGVNDMTLVDLIEMFCDWYAATKRHDNGNIRKSIEYNAERFHLNSQLTKIFENTAAEVFDE
jgi:hypothetical protein